MSALTCEAPVIHIFTVSDYENHLLENLLRTYDVTFIVTSYLNMMLQYNVTLVTSYLNMMLQYDVTLVTSYLD